MFYPSESFVSFVAKFVFPWNFKYWPQKAQKPQKNINLNCICYYLRSKVLLFVSFAAFAADKYWPQEAQKPQKVFTLLSFTFLSLLRLLRLKKTGHKKHKIHKKRL